MNAKSIPYLRTIDTGFDYIARCKCGCGAIVYAALDLADANVRKDIAKDTARLIRDGFSVERVPHDDVMNCKWADNAHLKEVKVRA